MKKHIHRAAWASPAAKISTVAAGIVAVAPEVLHLLGMVPGLPGWAGLAGSAVIILARAILAGKQGTPTTSR